MSRKRPRPQAPAQPAQNGLPMQPPVPQGQSMPPAPAGAPMRRKKKKRRPGSPPLSRSERQRRQVRRSKRRQIAHRLAFLVLTLGMAFLAVTVFFRVDRLKVTGTRHYSADEIIKTLGIEKGDNLFSFRTQALEKRLMKQYPYLSRVEITRQLPDVLAVKAVDAVPVVAVDVKGGGCFLADAQGKLLEQAVAVPAGLAPVTGVVIGAGTPGEMLKGEGKTGILLGLTRALDAAGMMGDVDFINVSASYDVRFGYLGRLDVRLGEATQLAEKLRMLGRIVEEELSPSDAYIVYLSDPKTAFCPLTTKDKIEQSMLPLEDIAPPGQMETQNG